MENQNSISFTRFLTDKIIIQDADREVDQSVIFENNRKVSKERQPKQNESLEYLQHKLSGELCIEKSTYHKKTSASNWLTLLPLKATGFSLNKQECGDVVILRNGWPIAGLCSCCECGRSTNVRRNGSSTLDTMGRVIWRSTCSRICSMMFPLSQCCSPWRKHLRCKTTNTYFKWSSGTR